jgi:hypothetical protein
VHDRQQLGPSERDVPCHSTAGGFYALASVLDTTPPCHTANTSVLHARVTHQSVPRRLKQERNAGVPRLCTCVGHCCCITDRRTVRHRSTQVYQTQQATSPAECGVVATCGQAHSALMLA